MSRDSRNDMLMATSFLWATQGTCSRLQVGAVFAREGRILVQGYNGAPAGLPHCDHECDCNRGEHEGRWDDSEVHWESCNSLQPCLRSVHAEQNGIAYAARWGVELGGSDAYVTHQPCVSCAMSIINAGVLRVHYCHPYRLSDGINLLEEAGIGVIRRSLPKASKNDRI